MIMPNRKNENAYKKRLYECFDCGFMFVIVTDGDFGTPACDRCNSANTYWMS